MRATTATTGARDHYDDRACAYVYDHTDDGFSYSQCEVHGGGEMNTDDEDEETEFEPRYEREGVEYYDRAADEVKPTDPDDTDPDQLHGHLEDESEDFDGDWEAEAEKKAREQEEDERQSTG